MTSCSMDARTHTRLEAKQQATSVFHHTLKHSMTLEPASLTSGRAPLFAYLFIQHLQHLQQQAAHKEEQQLAVQRTPAARQHTRLSSHGPCIWGAMSMPIPMRNTTPACTLQRRSCDLSDIDPDTRRFISDQDEDDECSAYQVGTASDGRCTEQPQQSAASTRLLTLAQALMRRPKRACLGLQQAPPGSSF
mmetsp:Transcript_3026/g.6568  ORF Transcript_3026/g.6568 Transcript_3026/m.6568 type:complete len:191 (-) Transcript_3026:756-1328(-)